MLLINGMGRMAFEERLRKSTRILLVFLVSRMRYGLETLRRRNRFWICYGKEKLIGPTKAIHFLLLQSVGHKT
jgi:hypothetical protein